MFTSGLIFWYSTRQVSINGNGKVAPAPLSSILCWAVEFSNGIKTPIKNTDNSNNSMPARIARFCILAHLVGIGYSSPKKVRFLWLVHIISVFYIVISRNREDKGAAEESKPLARFI